MRHKRRILTMTPRVSILIPAHNAGKWISQTIQSAAEQTWQRKEIIIVDDGSSDDTLTIARRLASPNISILSQPNLGASAARNTAYAHCQGDYIQWLDADDLLAPDKITKQMESLRLCETSRSLLSCAWGRFIKRPARAKFTPTALWCNLSPVEWMLRKMEQNIYIQTTAWLVSRELTDAAGPWDTRLWVDDDGEYFSRVILASDNVRFVPGSKTYYRMSGSGSLSQIGLSKRKSDAQLLSVELNISHLLSVDCSERARNACLTYLQMYVTYLCPQDPALVERAERLAASLGGMIGPPQLSWRFSWIKTVIGLNAAKKARFHFRRLMNSLLKAIDR